MIDFAIIATFCILSAIFIFLTWITVELSFASLNRGEMIDADALADGGTYVTDRDGDVRFEPISEEIRKKFGG